MPGYTSSHFSLAEKSHATSEQIKAILPPRDATLILARQALQVLISNPKSSALNTLVR